jgi:hypothetical protein
VLHADKRYYFKSEGGIMNRGSYAAIPVLASMSLTYYPSQTAGAFAQKKAFVVHRIIDSSIQCFIVPVIQSFFW